MRLPFSWSAGPVNARRQLPPYFPTSRSGFTTKSCDGSGRRLSTAGSLPALTCSASAGASLKVLGKALASRTISGPSSFPISEAPIFGAAGAAVCAATHPDPVASVPTSPRPASTRSTRVSFMPNSFSFAAGCRAGRRSPRRFDAGRRCCGAQQDRAQSRGLALPVAPSSAFPGDGDCRRSSRLTGRRTGGDADRVEGADSKTAARGRPFRSQRSRTRRQSSITNVTLRMTL